MPRQQQRKNERTNERTRERKKENSPSEEKKKENTVLLERAHEPVWIDCFLLALLELGQDVLQLVDERVFLAPHHQRGRGSVVLLLAHAVVKPQKHLLLLCLFGREQHLHTSHEKKKNSAAEFHAHKGKQIDSEALGNSKRAYSSCVCVYLSQARHHEELL